jgi:uncharacterized membrane protein
MLSLLTLLGGASLGAGGMYLMDPDRGHRRRAELRDALAEVDTDELVERARRLEPAVRQLGGSVGAMLEPARAMLQPARAMLEPARTMLEPTRWKSGSSLPRWTSMSRGLGWRRRRSVIQARDWALLVGLVGAIAASLWLARRWSAAGEGIEVVRDMTVDAPVERVYEFWNEFENFPRFMSHVHEVRRIGPDRTHWVVAGPGGTPIEWDAVVTRRVPNEEIAWQTVEGALVEHRGSVRFRPVGPGQTRIEVRMNYRPVGGALGHGLATLFGSDPERVIADDLDRLATQLRGPRAATGEAGPRR